MTPTERQRYGAPPAVSCAAREALEPDAVRNLAGVLAAELAPKFDEFLNNPGNPHLAADLRQWFWDNKSGILAALSLPAAGGEASKREAEIVERCAKIADAQAQIFLLPEYASNQPHGSMAERFACQQIADAIRASLRKDG